MRGTTWQFDPRVPPRICCLYPCHCLAENSESPVDVDEIVERVIAANPSPSVEHTESEGHALQKTETPTPRQVHVAPAPPHATPGASTPTPAPVARDSLAALDDLAPLPSAEVPPPPPPSPLPPPTDVSQREP